MSRQSQENQQWVGMLKDLRTALSDYFLQDEHATQLRTDYDELIKLTASKNWRDFSRIKDMLPRFVADADGGVDEQYGQSLRSVTLDSMKVGLLNDLFRSMLSEPTFEPTKKKLVVKGWLITTNSVNEYMKKNAEDLDKIEEVEIFALEKVFIDEDLNFTGKKIQLTIIAPRWEVVTRDDEEGRGKKKIVLDGKAGEVYGKDAGNLDVPGSNGNDGKQGMPGGAAGAFLGVGKSCGSCETLQISANGGQGGRGQDGGAGQKGKDGREASFPSNAGYEDCRVAREEWRSEGCNPSCKDPYSGPWYTLGDTWMDCEVDGGGRPGGNGGNGGQGGEGGNAGRASLLLQSQPQLNSQIIENLKGKPGNPGSGGTGGGGAMRKIWKFTVVGSCGNMINCMCLIMRGDQRIEEPYPQSKNGKDGLSQTDGPKSSVVPNYFHNPSLAINDYKNYLRQNLNTNQLMAPLLTEFIDFLEQDKNVTDLYDTLGLVKDLLSLEKQSGQTLSSAFRKQSYQRLLERVEKYQLQPQELRNADDYKLVLSYLYTAISSRIHSIDTAANNDLVVDVRKNLAYVEGNIDEWRIFKDLVEKNKVRNKYKDGIQRKIEEANAFIENEITKDIENNMQKSTEQLNKLYKETVDLENAAEKEKKKLVERKEQLERQLVLRSVLGVVQIASQALAIIGPVGAAAGAVIGGLASVAEGLATSGNPSADVVVSALPGAITTTLTKLNAAYKEKQEAFKKQLLKANSKMEAFLNDKDVKADASQAKTKVKEIQNDIAATKTRLDELVNRSNIQDPASISELYDLRKKMDGLLKKGKDEIGKLPGADKYKNVVDKVQNIVGLAKMGVDLYSKVQGDLDKIDGVDKSIAAVNAKMGQLDAYEESIYIKIGPMIKRIRESLASAENSEGKSHAALDITKWQVQGSIRDVRKAMQEMTKGFAAGNEITYYIDKVEYAMSMMIQMFDRIQSYGEQGDLVDVITDVDSAANVLNAELYTAMSELKMKISSNIITEYTATMDAVKQYVFPFASEYMRPLEMPERFNLNQTDQLAYNLRTLEKTLQREESTTLTRESNIMANAAFGEGENHSPFFVWKNREDVNKLLEGKMVNFYADIAKSEIQESAVKFNEIGIHFRSQDSHVQRQLNELLPGYTIRMEHHGVSYYRCNSNIYKLHHQPQTIIHSVVKNAHGDFTDSNLIYTKISQNEPVLSPFGYWSLIIEPGKNNIDQLKQLSGQQIDLVLEGRGNFVKKWAVVCNAELNKYYQLHRPYGQTRSSDGLGIFEEIFDKLEGYNMAEDESSLESELANQVTSEPHMISRRSSFPDELPMLNNFQGIVMLPDRESTHEVRGPINSVGLAGNLPLFELMIRKLNGTQRQKRSAKYARRDVDDLAHSLAYRAHIPH